MAGSTESGGGRRGSGWRIAAWAAVTALILLIPLVLTLLGDGVDGQGWNWDLFDFAFMGTLIFGTGLAYELVARQAGAVAYRAAVGVALAAAFLLVWVNAAVGIIGDPGGPNLMYFGVLAVGTIGAVIARLQPDGMARALLATAIAQMLVPVIVLAIPDLRGALMEPPGVTGIFGLNAFFAALWLISAWFFRKVARGRAMAH